MFLVKRFPVCFNLFVLLFLVTPCLVVAVQPCMEWIPFKIKKITGLPPNCQTSEIAIAILKSLGSVKAEI